VRVEFLPLALFGFALHAGVLLILQGLPAEVASHINERLAWPFLLAFTPATVLFALLLLDVEERQSTERALTDAAARLRAITRAIPDVLLVLDEEGNYLEVISAGPVLSRAAVPPGLGRRVHDVLPASQVPAFLAAIRQTLESAAMGEIAYELQTPSGLRYFEGRAQPLDIPVHGRAAVVFMARDVTGRMRAESALRESELRFRSVLRDVPSICVQGYRADGTTTYWNRASEQLYGYSAQEALGSNLVDLIVPSPMRELIRVEMQRMFASGEVIPAGELQLQRKDGSLVDVFSSHTFIEVPGQPREMFCIDIDISRRKAAEEEARYLAFYDALTRLPNRRLLIDRLQQVLANGARSGTTTAVLFVDLDNFKTLNDTQGHAVGDLLLQHVADRLLGSVRAQDTVARLGGDEFVVVLQNLSARAAQAATQARKVGEAILGQLRQPCVLGGRDHHFSASIGVALHCLPSHSVDEVLKQADMAMYRAKDAGRNTLRFFDPGMQQAVNRRALLEREMHEGLRHGQFTLFYQPQVDSQGCVTGAEVLVRWQHPAHGLVPPAEFIPLAEESGLILPLGRWIMKTALHQQARWRGQPGLQHLNLAINVSTRQLLQEDFVAQTIALLQESGADPARIKLELTESFLLQNVDGAAATMRALQTHGLQFSLDDFGTGYSSLNYLKRLPLSQIKIDQGFVRGVLLDAKDASIACTIIMLAGNLGLQVMAEGVETAEHHRFLLAQGCRAFQGYLFGRPMALSQFEQQVCNAGTAGHASAQIRSQATHNRQ
jgi:diguanylate cyclase (GGDEF)-like protein/PAS domain S-box-containing protein